MNDARIAAVTRGKLMTLKIAQGASLADAAKWADENLSGAVAKVKKVPKGSDPFAALKTLNVGRAPTAPSRPTPREKPVKKPTR